MTKFLEGVGHDPRNDGFNFGDDPDHRPDPGVEVRNPDSLDSGVRRRSALSEHLYMFGMSALV